MRAMILQAARRPLREVDLPVPAPGPDEVLLRVHACGVCRTDLHVIDGELTSPKLPLVPGHEVVGIVEARGNRVQRFAVGDRVGVPWLGTTCGVCTYCKSGRENLCDNARFTGYQIDGGYAEFTVADQRYCFAIPSEYSDTDAAPLLCAGLIGYRSLVMAGDARRLGIYGFGAAAHIVAQVARHQGREIYALRVPETPRPNASHSTWELYGQGIRRRRRRSNWMRRSFSPPSAAWFRLHYGPRPKAAQWSVAAST
jgi:propanol-preferring alcohol dehydrogenase